VVWVSPVWHHSAPYLIGFYGFNPPFSHEIVAASQSTALSIPRPVHGRGEPFYLMSLSTRVVVRCSISWSKFTKNRLSAPLRPNPLGPLAELRGRFATEKGGMGNKEREGGERREGRSPQQKS